MKKELTREARERLFHLAYAQTEEAIVVLDEEGEVVTWTRGAEELLGYSSEEIVGRFFEDMVAGSRRGAFGRMEEAARRGERLKNVEVELSRKDGVDVKALVTMYSLPDEPGLSAVLWIKPFGSAVLQELTDPIVRETVVQLQQLSAAGQLSAGVAHQIRTPLHVVQSTVELLRDQLPPDSPYLPSLEVVLRNVELLSSLSNALSGFARRKDHAFSAWDLGRLADQVCSFMEPLCKKQGIRLRRSWGIVPPVVLDADFLTGALYNLLFNAAEAMPEGGELSVDTSKRDGRVELSIADTGQGMDPAVLEQVGRPFFTTKRQGTGLGLFVTRQILDQHRAELKIESERGKGTRMVLSFPSVA